MADSGDDQSGVLTPHEAFSVLGNATRMDILQVLADADDRLAFSTLYDRADVDDSGQFTYHLNKLRGHFVRKTPDGYDLHNAGRRVVDAVLSGAVTEAPVVERTPIDQSCFYCGGPISMNYHAGQVGLYCAECRGQYEGEDVIESRRPEEQERTGFLELPPAGVQDRTPEEVLQAAYTWYYNQVVTMASGVCPRCSASIDHSVLVCESHDEDADICEHCGSRHEVQIHHRCPNCTLDQRLNFPNHLVDDPALHRYMADHDVDIVSPRRERVLAANADIETRLDSTEPFRATVVYELDGDVLELTVDETLEVTDATRETV